MKIISPQRVLLFYKKSAYKIYFLERKSAWFGKQTSFPAREMTYFKAAHATHYRTLAFVEDVLRRAGVRYHKLCRGRKINGSLYDLVITVGGDGTFLEAARAMKGQWILGVNSDPKHSVGRFCGADRGTFAQKFDKVLSGDFKIKLLPRISLTLHYQRRRNKINVLNDILICHRNPAAISRYYLTVNGKREEQRGSGLWIATAAGSSGAVRSAGGRIIAQQSPAIQYQPRELYDDFHRDYHYTGGVLSLKRVIVVESLMRNGAIYIDGAHLNYAFVFGDQAILRRSSSPIQSIFIP